MSGRIFALIFFFWAVLTILTPTLVILSESSKAGSVPNVGEIKEGTRPRRMMGDLNEDSRVKSPLLEAIAALSPAPAPQPSSETGKLSEQGLLKSNSTGGDHSERP